jgi:hypothetical protein
MRAAAFPLLAAIGLLAGCATDSQPVSQSAPSVSYRVPASNDVTQANANAARYCQQYNAGAQLQNLQPGPSGNIAVYSCTGVPGATAGTIATPTNAAPGYAQPGYAQPGYPPPGYAQQPGYGATLPPVQCADPLHQDRPGGTDYYGPPVPQCPPR